MHKFVIDVVGWASWLAQMKKENEKTQKRVECEEKENKGVKCEMCKFAF